MKPFRRKDREKNRRVDLYHNLRITLIMIFLTRRFQSGSYVVNDALLVRVDVVDPAPPFGAQVKQLVTTTNTNSGAHPPSYHLLTGVTQTPQHQNL